MKYKLLKDLPELRAGAIFTVIVNQHLTKRCQSICEDGTTTDYKLSVVLSNPDWFEPVIERWEPKGNDSFFYVSSFVSPEMQLDNRSVDWHGQFKSGNFFRTKEQAVEARDAIKKVIDELHRKWGE